MKSLELYSGPRSRRPVFLSGWFGCRAFAFLDLFDGDPPVEQFSPFATPSGCPRDAVGYPQQRFSGLGLCMFVPHCVTPQCVEEHLPVATLRCFMHVVEGHCVKATFGEFYS